MSGSKITCYIDIVSPFAYIAFHVLQVWKLAILTRNYLSNIILELTRLREMRNHICSNSARRFDECVWQQSSNQHQE